MHLLALAALTAWGMARPAPLHTLRPILALSAPAPWTIWIADHLECGDKDWKSLVTAGQNNLKPMWVIKNPENPRGIVSVPPSKEGEIVYQDSNLGFQTCIKWAVHEQNQDVLGFVSTQIVNGTQPPVPRSLIDVVNDVDNWMSSNPDLRGFYFDGVTSPSDKAYFGNLFASVREVFFQKGRERNHEPIIVADIHEALSVNSTVDVPGVLKGFLDEPSNWHGRPTVAIVFDGDVAKWQQNCIGAKVKGVGQGPFCQVSEGHADFVTTAIGEDPKKKINAKLGAIVRNVPTFQVPLVMEQARAANLEYLSITALEPTASSTATASVSKLILTPNGNYGSSSTIGAPIYQAPNDMWITALAGGGIDRLLEMMHRFDDDKNIVWSEMKKNHFMADLNNKTITVSLSHPSAANFTSAGLKSPLAAAQAAMAIGKSIPEALGKSARVATVAGATPTEIAKVVGTVASSLEETKTKTPKEVATLAAQAMEGAVKGDVATAAAQAALKQAKDQGMDAAFTREVAINAGYVAGVTTADMDLILKAINAPQVGATAAVAQTAKQSASVSSFVTSLADNVKQTAGSLADNVKSAANNVEIVVKQTAGSLADNVVKNVETTQERPQENSMNSWKDKLKPQAMLI